MATESQIIKLGNEIEQFNQDLSSALSAFTNIITSGTNLYQDALLVAVFPNSSTAYKAYLISLQTYINTTIANVPVKPPLNG